MKPFNRILLVYPEFEVTYWGMQYFLPLIDKKALMPPLGLITLAGLTPAGYEFKLVDLNCETLTEDAIHWADMVCFSAMLIQKKALFKTAKRCRDAGKRVIFGGPYPTACPNECLPHCDVLIRNEGEITWLEFLSDLENTGAYQKIYSSDIKPDIQHTAIPRFDLLNIDHYSIIPLQFSRGCPFLCEFCDIITLFGRKPRTKSAEQIIKELEAVYATGHRGGIFIVDDNFIGHKKAAKELLAQMIEWNTEKDNPFLYGTDTSIDLAEDPELMSLLAKANFEWIFIGLETPNEQSLKMARKSQNLRHPLLESIRTIQSYGLCIYGGFVIGFDDDDENIFDRQIEFISQAATPFAMVNPLDALPGTALHARILKEGRLLQDHGDFRPGHSNIKPLMPQKTFLEGYRKILAESYAPKAFFDRVDQAIQRLPNPLSLQRPQRKLAFKLKLLFKTLFEFRKLPKQYAVECIKLALKTYQSRPDQLIMVIQYAMIGIHYHRYTFETLIPNLNEMIDKLSEDKIE